MMGSSSDLPWPLVKWLKDVEKFPHLNEQSNLGRFCSSTCLFFWMISPLKA